MYILGIHGNFGRATHDAAAVLIKDNEIVAAAEEERFTRYKHAVGLMPTHAIGYCLQHAGISMKEIDYIAFPAATWTDFDTRLKSYLWYNFGSIPKIEYIDHHTAHAASAFFISGYTSSLIVTLDQSGDGIACGIFRGNQNKLKRIDAIKFPNSLGLFAGFITQYLGFRSNHDEYKVMGLAAYGKPSIDLSTILKFENGDLEFNPKVLHPEVMKRYPVFHTSQLPMFRDTSFSSLPPHRIPGRKLLPEHKNLAASAQKVIEEAIFAIVKKYKTEKDTHLCIAGGVAENSLANGKLAQSGLFQDIYVPPACNDAGSALGAALLIATKHSFHFNKVTSNKWGPSYSNAYIKKALTSYKTKYTHTKNVAEKTAQLLAQNKIVGWFQGRMEFGARALGSRSILAHPSSSNMKRRVNNIKKREEFRPFAPAILAEHQVSLFKNSQCSPFMSFTLDTTKKGTQMLKAATHIDGTGRVQTIENDGSDYRTLVEYFYKYTKIPALLNTSFNSSWEPIVANPEQALAFFYSSQLDTLVIGNFVVEK